MRSAVAVAVSCLMSASPSVAEFAAAAAMSDTHIPAQSLGAALETFARDRSLAAAPAPAPQAKATIDAKAVTHFPEFPVPFSDLASREAKANLLEFLENMQERQRLLKGITDPVEVRRIVDATYLIPTLQKLQREFPVVIQPETLGGVQTDVVIPKAGIAPKNKSRVLINLHGGGFYVGAHYGGQIESVPIASLGAIKVITVNYRMAPEARFPAASEDVAKVYTELLKSYRPENIGIYGCSAGAELTAQSTAWFQSHGLPRPGAIGMFSGGAVVDKLGDSGYVSAPLGGYGITPHYPETLYLRGADASNPTLSPAYHDDVLKAFPPSLIVSGTRDIRLSVALYTHQRLVELNVDADLHVMEGAQHCFTYWDLPESRQAWNVTIKFFDRHLRQ